MPEPTPSEIPSAIGSMPAVLTPGAVVPAPDFGFPSEVEDIVSPVKKRRFGPAAILAMAWIVFVVGGAILAPYLPIPTTTETVDIPVDAAGQPYFGPSLSHPFGLDKIGKDVFSLTLYGGRVSLLVGFVAVSVGMVIGGTMGIFAGYLRGKVDTVLSIFFDTFLAIPAIILALALVAAFDPADPDLVNPTRRIFVLAGALGVVSIPVLGRMRLDAGGGRPRVCDGGQGDGRQAVADHVAGNPAQRAALDAGDRAARRRRRHRRRGRPGPAGGQRVLAGHVVGFDHRRQPQRNQPRSAVDHLRTVAVHLFDRADVELPGRRDPSPLRYSRFCVVAAEGGAVVAVGGDAA